jgi:hypothetical protein
LALHIAVETLKACLYARKVAQAEFGEKRVAQNPLKSPFGTFSVYVAWGVLTSVVLFEVLAEIDPRAAILLSRELLPTYIQQGGC